MSIEYAKTEGLTIIGSGKYLTYQNKDIEIGLKATPADVTCFVILFKIITDPNGESKFDWAPSEASDKLIMKIINPQPGWVASQIPIEVGDIDGKKVYLNLRVEKFSTELFSIEFTAYAAL